MTDLQQYDYVEIARDLKPVDEDDGMSEKSWVPPSVRSDPNKRIGNAVLMPPQQQQQQQQFTPRPPLLEPLGAHPPPAGGAVVEGETAATSVGYV